MMGVYTRKAIKITLGVILLIIGGMFGLVVFVPGWPLGIIGFYLLATEIPWVKRHYDQFKAWIHRKIGRDPEEYVFTKMDEFKGYFTGNGEAERPREDKQSGDCRCKCSSRSYKVPETELEEQKKE